MVKDPIKVKRGKKSKAAGAAFELRVRKDLESNDWIVDKWSNNVEFEDIEMNEITGQSGKLIPAKHKFRGMGIPMAMGTGFPDFICFRRVIMQELNLESQVRFLKYNPENLNEVIGVEVKTNGYLDKIEKQKCKWYLENNIFSKILIAEKTKTKNRVVIVYHDFEEKYG